MIKQKFNNLALPVRAALVFGEGRLIGTFDSNSSQTIFYYKLNDLKIDVVYNKTNMKVVDIFAWENSIERLAYLKQKQEYKQT